MLNFYKCYTSITNDQKYYWYLKNNTTRLYCNKDGFTTSTNDYKNLERVGNISIDKLTDTDLQLICNKNDYINCKAEPIYDIIL